MTIGENLAWIEATPNQHHAVGRYQVIPKTLRRQSKRSTVLWWLATPRRGWFTIPTAGRNTARWTIRPCSANAAS